MSVAKDKKLIETSKPLTKAHIRALSFLVPGKLYACCPASQSDPDIFMLISVDHWFSTVSLKILYNGEIQTFDAHIDWLLDVIEVC